MNQNSTASFLRGMSALWVLLAHCCIWGGTTGFILDPKVAVDIFMMISGYLMALTATTSHKREPFSNLRNWVRFYLRRFFRISPGYYVSLAIAFLASTNFAAGYHKLAKLNNNANYLAINSDFSAMSFLAHVTYVFGLIPSLASASLLPDWSLSLEMQFYLIFPAVFVFLNKNWSDLRIVLLTILVLSLSFLSTRVGMPYNVEVSLVLYQLPFFLVGTFIFLAFREDSGSKLRILYSLSILLILAYAFRIKPQHDVVFIMAAILLAFSSWNDGMPISLVRFKSAMCRVFESKLITFLSDTSYSVYLYHGFFLSIMGSYIATQLLESGWSSDIVVVVIIACVLPTSYFAAWISHVFVEKPGIALGKKAVARLFGSAS